VLVLSAKLRSYIKGKGFKKSCRDLDASMGEEYLLLIGDTVPWSNKEQEI
jgi:hypothetical protein